jgi:hypothetical protein
MSHFDLLLTNTHADLFVMYNVKQIGKSTAVLFACKTEKVENVKDKRLRTSDLMHCKQCKTVIPGGT